MSVPVDIELSLTAVTDLGRLCRKRGYHAIPPSVVAGHLLAGLIAMPDKIPAELWQYVDRCICEQIRISALADTAIIQAESVGQTLDIEA